MSKRTDSMYATIIGIALAVVLTFAVIAALRFIFGGPEDTWICSGGRWVMHGKPFTVKPTIPCVQ